MHRHVSEQLLLGELVRPLQMLPESCLLWLSPPPARELRQEQGLCRGCQRLQPPTDIQVALQGSASTTRTPVHAEPANVQQNSLCRTCTGAATAASGK